MNKSNYIVTVTYGDRWHLLKKALYSARNEGFDRAVVVDNGAKIDISQLAKDEFGDFVDVVTMEKNTGSSGGFEAGMQRAIDLNADFLMLLDDDNELQPGCLDSLLLTYQESILSVPQNSLAVLAYRSDRQTDVAANIPSNGMTGNSAAFFGFHFLEVPFKLFRRTPVGRRWIARRPILPRVVVAIAPYSGMYFHQSVLKLHGLPDARFILYADDTDFSYRLTRAGGSIVLATNAKLVDLELSWNVKARFSNTFDALLLGDSDLRAFYSTRNRAYFEEKYSKDFKLIRGINKFIYLSALYVRSMGVDRKARFKLLIQAIRDGESGRLGVHPDFPLN